VPLFKRRAPGYISGGRITPAGAIPRAFLFSGSLYSPLTIDVFRGPRIRSGEDTFLFIESF
jgi:hypothetical protein